MIKAALLVVTFALPGGEIREHRERAPSMEVCKQAAQLSKREIEILSKMRRLTVEKLVFRARCLPIVEV